MLVVWVHRCGANSFACKYFFAVEVTAVGQNIDLIDGHLAFCPASHGREQRPVGDDAGDVVRDDQMVFGVDRCLASCNQRRRAGSSPYRDHGESCNQPCVMRCQVGDQLRVKRGFLRIERFRRFLRRWLGNSLAGANGARHDEYLLDTGRPLRRSNQSGVRPWL